MQCGAFEGGVKVLAFVDIEVGEGCVRNDGEKLQLSADDSHGE